MANHKSAVKAHTKSIKSRDRNISILSRIKTFIKKLEEMITSGNHDEAKVAFQKAESEIMKGASKGALKKNTASRKVSRYSKKLKTLEKK